MNCRECGEKEVIRFKKPEHVVYQCKNGHKWFEHYIENGGVEKKPKSFKIKLKDTLFPSEKRLYNGVLEEIQKNPNFFTNSSPQTITSYLIDECKFNREAIYSMFKKVNAFENKDSINIFK